MKRVSRRTFLAATGMTALAAAAAPAASAAGSENCFAAETKNVQLIGTVTDAGQVVSGMVIDYSSNPLVTVSGVDNDTYTVHAVNNLDAALAGTDIVSYGDYEIDRKIVKTEVKGSRVTVYFDQSEGATLCYTSASRNYPGELDYTVTQNKPVTLSVLGLFGQEYTTDYFCDNTVQDEEVAKFTSEIVPGGINYQLYKPAGGADKLVVWFHGNGEGDMLGSNNNVAQVLGNRGTVAWASDEFQAILGGAYVMAFQAPDTWYYAQRDGLLDQAAAEIRAVISVYGIDPAKVLLSGCSAGGYMSTRMLIAHPDLFTAAMINCPALDVATDRGGQTPTDDELRSIKASGVPVWLVQGATDSSVATDECSKRMFGLLTEGETLTETRIAQADPNNSALTTWETADGLYKLSLYDTTPDAMLCFAEDYDLDGVTTQVQYSNHWSWIYTLRNNPQDASGTHIVNWAVAQL